MTKAKSRDRLVVITSATQQTGDSKLTDFILSPPYPAPHAMNSSLLARLIHFLQEELLIPAEAIQIALRQGEMPPNLLPIVLWQYGLVTLEHLDKIFDWLETV
ncbi:MAG: DUF2949 domain-containing protein [Leptolyngbyaceae cyanobacterium bins.349]|nr:DUF2949 domain-containing protein [Leptolyngbyaceae cyanobacterium bins.349]